LNKLAALNSKTATANTVGAMRLLCDHLCRQVADLHEGIIG